MQRRNFIRAGAAGAIAVAGQSLATAQHQESADVKELIEWRVYEMAWGGNRGLLQTYLADTLQPALRRKGATQFVMFREYGQTDPAKVHVMIAYRDAAAYVDCQSLATDAAFQDAAKEYDAVEAGRPVYSRFSSWLMNAFDAMPQAAEADGEAGLFELRIYEGYSEDANRRKIRMFNEYEVQIFRETGLDAVFYGEMLAGPYRPALVYLLQFDDMAKRDENWGNFGSHPEWNRIKDLPEFADSVSNIRRVFLMPVS